MTKMTVDKMSCCHLSEIILVLENHENVEYDNFGVLNDEKEYI